MSENSKCLTLREIANWQIPPKSISSDQTYVEVPTFQRGLVWNAAQIEVLWDSLLRGIPIGSFSLLPSDGGVNYSKKGQMKRGGYWLLDGQQRSNAIALGFAEYPSYNSDEAWEDIHAILWIDILPDDNLQKRSNRKYFFYVTTEGRPWGYVISDANGENRAGKVLPNIYRQALDGIPGDRIRPAMRDLWPVSSRLPIPFSVFRKWVQIADTKDIIQYLKDSRAEFSEFRWYGNVTEALDRYINQKETILNNALRIKAALLRAEKTEIIAMVAPKELSQDTSNGGKSEEEMERDSEIAVYFARLNKNGTIPSPVDLNYSILKSTNPALGRIDTAAQNLMHPAHLADLVMRVYKSFGVEPKSFVRSVSRRDAFKLGKDPEFIKYVTPPSPDQCSERPSPKQCSEFELDLKKVAEWLDQDQSQLRLPPVLKTMIARNSPNLYQMLILLARMNVNLDHSRDHSRLIALVTLLAWFGEDGCLDYPRLFKELLDDKNNALVVDVIRDWLADQVETNALCLPPSLNALNQMKDDLDRMKGDLEAGQCGWEILKNKLIRTGDLAGLERLWNWQKSAGVALLLYACREYLNKTFSYDPASAVWSEDSRPWDYDHIIPQNWLITGSGNSQGKCHRFVDSFLNSIGNIAPIPFSMNRSKHDDAPIEYLGGCQARSLVHIPETDYEYSFFKERPKGGHELENDPDTALNFAKVVLQRFRTLYDEWLNLPVLEWLDFQDNPRGKRTKLANDIKGILNEVGLSSLHYYYPYYNTCVKVVEKCDWARPWLRMGVTIEEYFCESRNKKVVAFACVEEQRDNYVVGIRRHPDDKDAEVPDGWFESFRCGPNEANAVAKFKELLTKYKESIVAQKNNKGELE